ncbi:protoporphyrinogen/coproporphyrinogen oxidase [Sphingomonas canadensis]|uniref:Protoporphyrinogen/coproporphyrinogen oxidase n=1 Tax=Sphingomonas canadensis TaxID=1219257 RepID=A0ABW3H7T7_9SPHN|nr:FAD-dependent oxidoreductase [Sphingomonas canadensis]MCW3836190.1 FAD-dependent oxidoreductase [Sphingomonas canadensis]
MGAEPAAANAPRIVVVGAGIAGLTAAYRLGAKGFAVTVLEASESPGGRCREIMVEGLRLRAGARLLYSFHADLMRLIADLGLGDHIVRLGGATIECEDRGRVYPLPMGVSTAVLRSAELPLREKLGLARLLPELANARLRGNPDDLASLPGQDGIDLQRFLHKRGLSAFERRLVAPAFRGARGWDTDRVAPAFFLLTAAHGIGAHVFTFRDGLGTLATALASGLDVRYGMRAARIAAGKGHASVEGNGLDGPFRIEADIVLCATEGSLAGRLIDTPAQPMRNFLASVRYNGMAIAHAVLDRPLPARQLFLGADHPSRLAIVESVPGSGSPEDPPRLFCELAPELSGEAERDLPLSGHIAPHLDGILDGRTVERWVDQRIPAMLPLPYPGYAARMKTYRDWQSARPRRVYLAGDYLATALVGGACASGGRTAADIIGHWS